MLCFRRHTSFAPPEPPDYLSHAQGVGVIPKSVLVGVLAGGAASLYRFCLTASEGLALSAYGLLRDHLAYIPAALLAALTLGYGAGLIIARNPMAGGSGIPQLRGTITGRFRIRWPDTLASRFAGGTLALLAGLSLGRGAPSVHLGGCVAQGVSGLLKATDAEKRMLLTCGAGAGLAAAFGAPLAGVALSLEEVCRQPSPRLLLSALTAALPAFLVSSLLFGAEPVFPFPVAAGIPLDAWWTLLPLGAALGLLGALFNRSLLFSTRCFGRFPVKTRVLVPFALACCLGIVFPSALGGGHALMEQAVPATAPGFLALAIAVKVLFTLISFGPGTPGGLFFPLLAVGGAAGALFGSLTVQFLGASGSLFYSFAVLSMGGCFAAVVRAPVTGILLVAEMTGSLQLVLPLALVSVLACGTAGLLGAQPVYDSLLAQRLREQDLRDASGAH